MKTLSRVHCSALGRPSVRPRLLLAAVSLLAGILAGRTCEAAAEWRMATSLYNDVKARQVGDIVMVLIEETSSMNREANQTSGKSTSGSGNASFQYPTVQRGDKVTSGPWTKLTLPDFNWQLKHDFTGGGTLKSEEDFSSTMSAMVLDVLPNGNLVLEGKRTIHLQDEKVNVILSGMVRPRDISSDNVVSSSRLADASIRYVSDGPITRDQQRGLLTRLLNWLNPF